jgi:peptide-methionine (S)-S-oxide reductase
VYPGLLRFLREEHRKLERHRLAASDRHPDMELRTVVVAGGCFWGMEEVFQHVRGVTDVVSGYAGGSARTAKYDRVCTGTTGHAESVKITYDASGVTLGRLLQIYFSVAHDPTQKDGQGPAQDRSTARRSFSATNASSKSPAPTSSTSAPRRSIGHRRRPR